MYIIFPWFITLYLTVIYKNKAISLTKPFYFIIYVFYADDSDGKINETKTFLYYNSKMPW